MHYEVTAVFTNAPPTDAYRGAGKPESAATLERLLDLAAQRLGMDPLEFRRRNLLKPEKLPYATAMGETYDGGNFPLLAEKIEEISDWAGYEARQESDRALRTVGKGISRLWHGLRLRASMCL